MGSRSQQQRILAIGEMTMDYEEFACYSIALFMIVLIALIIGGVV